MMKDIRSLTSSELKKAVILMGEKPFRSKQLEEWIWTKSAKSFDQMTSLSKSFREKLSEKFYLRRIVLSEKQKSRDGTIKCAFEVEKKSPADSSVVEGVLIPTQSRMTACISSQVGCSLACKFCATGRLKLMKNLSAAEMYDQVENLASIASEEYNVNLSNIVYMGMGEPLLNYSNVLESVNRICGTPGLGMSPKRITVSTAGIAKAIKRLGDDEVRFNLALSLHAANDEKRSKIMAINETNSLEELAESLKYFYEKTGTRVTFEYIIFKDFNDEIKDARELAKFCKNVPCKINIIEYNAIDEGEFEQAEIYNVDAFAKFLEDRNLIVNVRRSRGKDIDAACGQLANKNKPGEGALKKVLHST
ncbi:MAG: 23S rRNA (adenine(2503)-C(2))-methyltransferase RlmN [Crocinitomicaceae bacterium]|nr:23S rRNA (adenine(2503)-C(2))-methyltransferase RlmN [Crocinitomicaceae bacterium]|tara:strand:+ start:3152 stop:4240 length:1089 start_codon:yes stop_codon:yes gene_type:complete